MGLKLNLEGEFLVNTKVKQQVDNQPPVDRSINTGDTSYENMQSFAEATTQSTNTLKQNAALQKEFGDILPEIIKNLRYMNSAVEQTTRSLPAIKRNITDEDRVKDRLAGDRERSFSSLVNTSGNIAQSYASGNVAGMANSFFSGSQNILNYGRDAARAKDNQDLAGFLGKLGIGAMIGGTVVGVVDAFANKYIEEMPTIFGSGRAFGDMSDLGSTKAYQVLNSYNRGTNLNTQEFNSIAQSLRKQGVGNGMTMDEQLALAGSIAQTTSRWAYATGGDADQYASLAGLMSRYGGSRNVSEDFNRIVSSGYASGLNDSQIPEFLSGIQKVMEEGIARGFNRSATEVADTLLMFSKMSGGNAFWQGEQGARLLNQANAGIAGATALSKTEDILVYRAMADAYGGTVKDKNGRDISKVQATLGDTFVQNGGYVNTMQLIEKGITADNFDDIKNTLDSAYGSDQAAKIEALRNMTGLNYTGAARLLNLDVNDKNYDVKLKDIMAAPENQNKETQYQAAMNTIKESVVGISENLADLKIAGMSEVAKDVNKIAMWLGGDYETREKIKKAEDLFNSLSDDKKSYYLSSPELMKRAKNEKLGLEDLEKLSKWNGFGRIPGVVDDYIFNDPTGLAPDPKQNETWADMEGAWALDNRITKGNIKDFIKLGFGAEILKQYGGNEKNADYAIDILAHSKDAEDLRSNIYNWSNNESYTKDEQDKTLKMILQLLQEGITMH